MVITLQTKYSDVYNSIGLDNGLKPFTMTNHYPKPRIHVYPLLSISGAAQTLNMTVLLTFVGI